MEKLIAWIKESGATFEAIPPKPATPEHTATIYGGWYCNKRMPTDVMDEAYKLTFAEVLEAAERAKQ